MAMYKKILILSLSIFTSFFLKSCSTSSESPQESVNSESPQEPVNSESLQEPVDSFSLKKSINYVLSFDGADDFIKIEDSTLMAQIANGDFTLEAWVKAKEGEQVTHPQILSNRESNGRGFLFGLHGRWNGSANKIPYVQLVNINWIDYPKQPNILDGTWHHFVARREGNTLTYFIDGQPTKASFTSEPIGNYDLSSNQALLIGKDAVNPGATPFKGQLAEIRIWKRALQETEIRSAMRSVESIDQTDLVSYWSLNEGSGEQVKDLSGNNYHGSIIGATWVEENRK